MKPVCFFSPADDKNLKYFQMLEASFKKFHPDIPLLRVPPTNDPHFFYRAAPVAALQLMDEYETVIKIDADSIVCGDLSTAWDGDFDAACVYNSNPREFASFPYRLWDINPMNYVNCGLVVMKSRPFVEHWHKLCFSEHFTNYQMREQDLLNIMVHYGDYKIGLLDMLDSFWGLSSKGYWPAIEKQGNGLVLPPQEGYTTENKTIKVIHWAGGADPTKMTDLNLRFKPEVAKHLKWLIS